MEYLKLLKEQLPSVIALAACALISIYGTSNVYEKRIAQMNSDFSSYKESLANEKSNALQEQADKYHALQGDLAKSEYQRHEELTNALDKNNRLANDLAMANKRLSIQIQRTGVCEAGNGSTSNTGMDKGETAFLSADAGRTYTSLRQNIIMTEKKLDACQDRLQIIEDKFNKESPK